MILYYFISTQSVQYTIIHNLVCVHYRVDVVAMLQLYSRMLISLALPDPLCTGAYRLEFIISIR